MQRTWSLPGLVLSLLFGISVCVHSVALPGRITSVDWGHQNHRLFAERALYFEDVAGDVTAEQAYREFRRYYDEDSGPWQYFASSMSRRLKSNISLWCGLRIVNDSDHPQTLYYRNSHTTVHDSTLFLAREGNILESAGFGDVHSSKDWPIPYHQFTFPIELQAGESIDLLIVIRNATFPHIDIERSILASERELALSDDIIKLVAWAVMGALMLLGVLSIVASLRLQSRQFALLAVISIMAGLMQLDFQGYLEYYLWPDSLFLKSKSLLLFSIVMLPSTVWFFVDHLSLRKQSKPLYRLVISGVLIMIAVYATGLAMEENYILPLIVGSWLWLLLCLCLLLVAFVLWRRGSAVAGRMLVIWSVYALICLFGGFVSLFISYAHYFNLLVANLTVLLLISFLFVTAFIELREHRYERDVALAESQAKSNFLARMSHEIRTPMNGVIGMAELLADTPLNETQQNYINVIYNSGRTLIGVINEILDFSKLTAGKMDLEVSEGDISLLAEECINLFMPQAKGRNIELVCDIDLHMPVHWLFDEVRLRQILFNLLGNALKFTEKGEIRLSLSALPDNEGIVIAVSDTGIGIDREKLDDLFEAFAQADVSTSRRYGGTGLGLAICKELVGLMGGSISVESKFGSGSTFRIALPLELAPGRDNLHEIKPLSQKHVLIVDKHAATLSILEAQARHLGMRVDTAMSAQSALRKANEAEQNNDPYDLIVIDIVMTESDSYALVVELKNALVSADIVLQSSSQDKHAEERCRELGVAFVSLKPKRINSMYQLLARAFTGDTFDIPLTRDVQDASKLPALNILVAEDNNVNFIVISTMLQKLGYEVDRAYDGQVAINAFLAANVDGKRPGYDLIFMDCEMPGISGFEATGRIRSIEKKRALTPVRIVALTAHVMDDIQLKCQQSGMDAYLSKPVNLKALQQELLATKPV